MIHINLLPFRTSRKKENIRRQASLFLLSLILVVVGLVYYTGILGDRIEETNLRIEDTRRELDRYNKIAKEVTELKKTLEAINNKMNIIQSLEVQRDAAVRLVDAMTELVVPRKMWLTSLEDTGTNLSLRGVALDNKTVADFMKRLEGSGSFSSVDLESLAKSQLEGASDLKDFTINCKREGPVQEATQPAGGRK